MKTNFLFVCAILLAVCLKAQTVVNISGANTATWTAPSSGGPFFIRITARGADGGMGRNTNNITNPGGQGAYMSGIFTVESGETVLAVSGSKGGNSPDFNGESSGGSCSGAVRLDNSNTHTLLIIAGGGNGSGKRSEEKGEPATITPGDGNGGFMYPTGPGANSFEKIFGEAAYSLPGGICQNNIQGAFTISPGDGYVRIELLERKIFYRDQDEDDYGDDNNSSPGAAICPPEGYVANSDDDSDLDPAQNPETVWYKDADDDGYSDGPTKMQRSKPGGYKLLSQLKATIRDCNDDPANGGASVYPAAFEICDGFDNDCNGQVDEVVKSTFYRDADCDGYGDPLLSTEACTPPAGFVADNRDCNDDPANGGTTVYPGAHEICDGLDNDCNGQVDDVANNGDCDDSNQALSPPTVWYKDAKDRFRVSELVTIQLYPNPTNGHFVINVDLPGNIHTTAKIELVNLMGQTVATVSGNIINGILNKTVFISPSVANGIYIVKIVANDKVYIGRLVYGK